MVLNHLYLNAAFHTVNCSSSLLNITTLQSWAQLFLSFFLFIYTYLLSYTYWCYILFLAFLYHLYYLLIYLYFNLLLYFFFLTNLLIECLICFFLFTFQHQLFYTYKLKVNYLMNLFFFIKRIYLFIYCHA